MGGITNLSKDNSLTINFSETDYDLSSFSTKTVTYPKMQELESEFIINCFKKFFLKSNSDKKRAIINSDQNKCENRKLTSISEELYKRLILPFYTLIISLIAASLIIEPKSKYFNKFHRINIFLLGSFIIILSQISLKFFLLSVGMVYTILILPLILVIFYYLFLLIFTKFRLNYL